MADYKKYKAEDPWTLHRVTRNKKKLKECMESDAIQKSILNDKKRNWNTEEDCNKYEENLGIIIQMAI